MRETYWVKVDAETFKAMQESGNVGRIIVTNEAEPTECLVYYVDMP